MNILIMANIWFPIKNDIRYSGIETIVDNHYKILSKKGHNLSILGTKDSDEGIFQLPFYSKIWYKNKGIRRKSISREDLVKSITEVVDMNNIDVILLHCDNLSIINAVIDIKKDHNITVLMFNHNIPNMGMISKLLNEAYFESTKYGCLTVSPAEYIKKANNKLVNNCIIDVFPSNYIDESEYIDISKKRNDRVIALSRIDKGMKEEAVSLAFKLSNKYCDMYGALNPEYEEFFNEKIKPNLNEKVSYKGQIGHQQVLNVLSETSLMVHPVIDDAAPNAVVESLSCGVPVITLIGKEECGTNEIMRDMGIHEDNLCVEIHRKRKESAAELIKEKILYFFDSEYNTIEYRKFISDKCREYFNLENCYERLMSHINKAKTL